MKLSDIKKYRGYMPVRMEREDVLYWLGDVIGGGWIDRLWKNRYNGCHEIRYRFGDVQEAQVYMNDKTWNGMPIEVWLKISEMNTCSLDEACWKWIRKERGTERKSASVKGSILSI